MIVVNAPEQLMQVQCYRCRAIMDVHPMTNMNAPWVTDCDKHKQVSDKHKQDNCRHGLYENSCKNCICDHVSDGLIYTSNPPKNKCRKCGEFYR